jgi:hypothetical protein
VAQLGFLAPSVRNHNSRSQKEITDLQKVAFIEFHFIWLSNLKPLSAENGILSFKISRPPLELCRL